MCHTAKFEKGPFAAVATAVDFEPASLLNGGCCLGGCTWCCAGVCLDFHESNHVWHLEGFGNNKMNMLLEQCVRLCNLESVYFLQLSPCICYTFIAPKQSIFPESVRQQ
jgi:hypothetical protein